MKLKWPEGYQERIESIIGAQFDETGYVKFLGFDTNKTIREGKERIGQIQLIQKQLRQIKTELGNKINIIKSQSMARMRKKGGGIFALMSSISDINSGREIDSYKRIALTIDKLLNACEKRKIEIEIWIEQQKPNVKDESFVRQPIPDEVQMFVWNRDNGKCVKCGSQENLEFDHIIPISKGGSNTARNIQLLCESCNRKKAMHIGG